MKTSDLIGPALDWAVAKCEGLNVFTQPIANNQTKYCVFTTRTNYKGEEEYGPSSFSVNWAQGGPIIERERIAVEFDGSMWVARLSEHMFSESAIEYGSTALEAAMKCYVMNVLSDEVEIPEELK